MRENIKIRRQLILDRYLHNVNKDNRDELNNVIILAMQEYANYYKFEL